MEVLGQFFKELGTARIVSLATSIFIVLLLGGMYFYKISQHEMVVLFSDLELNDSNKIIQELDSKNVPYEIIAGGSLIKVPEDKVLRLRMEFAQASIPSKGSLVGYEIFDGGESLSTSSFLQNVNLVRALEGELSRTITSFDPVDNARVHLVIPKRDLFSREKQEPRASVVLKLRGNSTLKKNEIDAIGHLVVTAIPDLDYKNISIVDTKGRAFKLGARGDDSPDIAAGNASDYKVSFENRLKHVVEDLLEQSLGVGKVKAYVSADLNFDRIITNSEIYDPNGQVARSIQTVEEKESNNAGENASDVSVANNLPGKTSKESSNNMSTAERIDETTNFEISKTIKNHISETGSIKKLSIAVMIDGTYKKDATTGEYSYAPRSEEELKKYESLVKSAVGFDENRQDKIEVANIQFIADLDSLKEEGPQHWIKEELPSMVNTFVVGLVIVLVLLLVVRPIAMKTFEVTREEIKGEKKSDHLDLLAMDGNAQGKEDSLENIKEAMIDVEKVEAAFSNNSNLRKINEVVDRYPTETANLLRKWLQEEN